MGRPMGIVPVPVKLCRQMPALHGWVTGPMPEPQAEGIGVMAGQAGCGGRRLPQGLPAACLGRHLN